MLSILFLSIALAVPMQLTQQGRLLDNSNNPVSGAHLLTFRIYDDMTSGDLLWTEALTVNFNNGYYATVLGANEFGNPLDSVILSAYPVYLEVQLDQNAPFSPRQNFRSVPYAQIAGIAESVDGGNVRASSIAIGGTVVIDGDGNWVGPSLSWSNIDPSSIPSDLQDGDSDTLMGLHCLAEQVVGWNGSNWICMANNSITADDIGLLLSDNNYDLHADTTIGGINILTEVDDKDTLGGLSCLSDGEVATYDLSNDSWYCNASLNSDDVISIIEGQSGLSLPIDSTVAGNEILTTASTLNPDWNSIQSIPSDLQDGDAVLSEGDVENYVTNEEIDLHANSTVDGKMIVTAPPSCSQGQILSYDSDTSSWICIDFSTIIDQDGDGVFAWLDCDDEDTSSGAKSEDTDCDGAIATEDCNDNDASSTIVANDEDCDGVVTEEDCDDTNASLLKKINDEDCDGILVADDCDDTNGNLLDKNNDIDCDGYLSADDCDDNDATAFGNNGKNENCPAVSCAQILSDGFSTGDGNYFLNPSQLGVFLGYCEMDQQSGGWTLLLSADGNSTYWGNNSPNWEGAGSGDAPSSLQNTDHHSSAYSRLQTNNIMICYQDTDHCYVFEHNYNISLQDFFVNDITYTAYTYQSYGYSNVGSSSILTDYENAIGETVSRHSCQWLGINEQRSISSIGYLADGNGGCNGGGYAYHDDAALGVGLQSCQDANGCDNGGSGHKAGRSRHVNGIDASGVLGPWFVFGK